MSFKKNQLQLQYQGFVNTPLLWKKSDVMGLQQLLLPEQDVSQFTTHEQPNLRLGKRVEQFVFFQLSSYNDIKILLKNTQIQNNKQTIGEIDCILELDQTFIHLEIVYKFYLYDPNHGQTEIEHWIGPNRKDTLLKKITKLNEKQLPLLYNEHTQKVLKPLQVQSESIKQQVYFKAQLFLPFEDFDTPFDILNSACISGFYIHYTRIAELQHCKFFIPDKIDWLQETQNQVDWCSYSVFCDSIESVIQQKIAPLCWIKFPKGRIQKCFVVWWP
ncbi:DUF1853 family protein [Tamlana sp. s12]|uniref:DUF1853 family protein n=1 Tax=Tamlana sp. s12 TaxID=1630406 RepID=UPI0007FC24C9|nr:DUF1853 family protein [Tamlana sp. s12]OBQ52502.1 hypothetical protein VQ01_13500 [Tamlana sp. s12]QQY81445.1 DUF1853 family protein [Tamlana sp. s12]